MNYKKEPREDVGLQIIHNAISSYFNIDKIELFSRTRKTSVSIPRQWFFYLARDLNPQVLVPLDYIGKHYSDVTGKPYNHATVLHAYKTIKGNVEVMKSYAKIKQDLLFEIKKKIDSEGYLIDTKGKTCFPCEINQQTVSLF